MTNSAFRRFLSVTFIRRRPARVSRPDKHVSSDCATDNGREQIYIPVPCRLKAGESSGTGVGCEDGIQRRPTHIKRRTYPWRGLCRVILYHSMQVTDGQQSLGGNWLSTVLYLDRRRSLHAASGSFTSGKALELVVDRHDFLLPNAI